MASQLQQPHQPPIPASFIGTIESDEDERKKIFDDVQAVLESSYNENMKKLQLSFEVKLSDLKAQSNLDQENRHRLEMDNKIMGERLADQSTQLRNLQQSLLKPPQHHPPALTSPIPETMYRRASPNKNILEPNVSGWHHWDGFHTFNIIAARFVERIRESLGIVQAHALPPHDVL